MIFYNYCWFLLIYSFIGWIIEVIYQAVVKGKILNRGFLNGPVCPVYGFGMSAVLLFYNLINYDNVFVVFLEGIVLTTAIELFAGFILDKFFHARWWDYSKMPFNLNGYICLAFSIIWGLAVVFAVKVAHPAIYNLTVANIPTKYGYPILFFLYAIFIADTIVTTLILIGLNKRLKELDEISVSMRRVSDRMSTRIGENSLKTAQAVQESRVQVALAKAEVHEKLDETINHVHDESEVIFKELNELYEQKKNELIKHKHYGHGRILHAFPNAKHRNYSEVLKDIQKKIKAK